jgi:nucleoid-associated protein YgaU
MFLFAFAFVVVTAALVVIQPGTARRPAEASGPEPVTRAAPDSSQSLEASIVRSIIASDPAPSAPTAPPAQLAPRAAIRPAAPPLEDQEMRRMTWEALSGLNQATGQGSAPGQPGSLLHAIVRRSLEGTPAPTARAVAPDPTPPGGPGVYVVQPGDSLVSIADRIYGDVNMTGPLYAANQAQLPRPDSLRPGQTLILPEN